MSKPMSSRPGHVSNREPAAPKLPKLPKDGRQRKGRSRFRRFLRVVIIGSLAAIVVGGTGLAYAWSSLTLPPDRVLSQTTFVTDSKGEQLASFNAGENRTPVTYSTVPDVLRAAVIATEDRNFYAHKGVDPKGIARALYTDVRQRAVEQGGSTLSQQYVKTVYVGADRTLVRKVKEAILAVKLEQRYSKDEILTRYMNAIYFGRGAYGVQEASRAYFNKDVSRLDLKEASYIAGLIRGPELADASRNPEQANQRRDLTLDSMVLTRAITPEQRAEIAAIPVNTYVVARTKPEQTANNAPPGSQYFIDYVRRTLTQRYGEQKVESGGLRVRTTLDANMQRRAYDSVYGFLKPGEPAGALVTVDQTGAIKAMVGGRDWKESQVNLAVGRDGGGTGRQAGSTFKPFTLAAAVDEGVCRRETFPAPGKALLPNADNGRDWTVSNYEDEAYRGRVDLVDATAQSINTVYAQLNRQVGPAKTAAMARSAGITSPVDTNIANVLGTDSVSALELADAYMTFGQNGLKTPSNPIMEVRTADGDLLEKLTPQRTRAMSVNTAKTVNLALQQVVSRGTGTAAQINRPVAGKTGTTSDYGDAWFVGYTPTLSTAVWMGYPEGSSKAMDNVRGRKVSGGSYPAQIFGNYMGSVVPRDSSGFDGPSDCRVAGDFDTTTTEDPFGDSNDNDSGNGQSGNGDGNNGNGNGNGGDDDEDTTPTSRERRLPFFDDRYRNNSQSLQDLYDQYLEQQRQR